MSFAHSLCCLLSRGRDLKPLNFFKQYYNLRVLVSKGQYHTYSRYKTLKFEAKSQVLSHQFDIDKYQVSSLMSVKCYSSRSSKMEDLEGDVEGDYKRTASRMSMMRRDRLESIEYFNKLRQEKDGTVWCEEDWTQLSKQISSMKTGAWDVMCMHTLMVDSDKELGRSLMNFLEAQSEQPNYVIITFYINLLGKTSYGNTIQEDEMKKYYDKLVSTTDIFDAASIEVLVEGLSKTKYYKECVSLLETFRLTSPPGLSVLRHILMAAMHNHDDELSTFILDHFERDLEPSQLLQCAVAIIDTAVKGNNKEGVTKFYNFMQKHSLSLLPAQLEEVIQIYQGIKSEHWKGSFGFVHYKSGQCSRCGQGFPKLEISDKDFQAVRSAFLDQVIVSDNIFFKTSPEEVNSFMQFVQKFGPFDVVIDGLNALHAVSAKKRDKHILERLVFELCKEDKRVLILGSKVLRNYVKNFGKFKPKPAVYMTSTTRADDAFFLYAALHSGKDTYIVSADKLRDHKFRLAPHLRPIFHQWLMSVQVYRFYNVKNNSIHLKHHMFSLGPLKDKNGWHIPVNDTDKTRSFGRQGVLCLRHESETLHQECSGGHRSVKPNNSDGLSKSISKDWFEL